MAVDEKISTFVDALFVNGLNKLLVLQPALTWMPIFHESCHRCSTALVPKLISRYQVQGVHPPNARNTKRSGSRRQKITSSCFLAATQLLLLKALSCRPGQIMERPAPSLSPVCPVNLDSWVSQQDSGGQDHTKLKSPLERLRVDSSGRYEDYYASGLVKSIDTLQHKKDGRLSRSLKVLKSLLETRLMQRPLAV